METPYRTIAAICKNSDHLVQKIFEYWWNNTDIELYRPYGVHKLRVDLLPLKMRTVYYVALKRSCISPNYDATRSEDNRGNCFDLSVTLEPHHFDFEAKKKLIEELVEKILTANPNNTEALRRHLNGVLFWTQEGEGATNLSEFVFNLERSSRFTFKDLSISAQDFKKIKHLLVEKPTPTENRKAYLLECCGIIFRENKLLKTWTVFLDKVYKHVEKESIVNPFFKEERRKLIRIQNFGKSWMAPYIRDYWHNNHSSNIPKKNNDSSKE